MDSENLKVRTKDFSLRIIHLIETLPPSRTSDVIGKQLLRSGTSVGANYRSACRARSRPDFISKIEIAIEEADESLYWMELLIQASIIPESRLSDLLKETDELIAILTASAITTKKKIAKENLPDARNR